MSLSSRIGDLVVRRANNVVSSIVRCCSRKDASRRELLASDLCLSLHQSLLSLTLCSLAHRQTEERRQNCGQWHALLILSPLMQTRTATNEATLSVTGVELLSSSLETRIFLHLGLQEAVSSRGIAQEARKQEENADSLSLTVRSKRPSIQATSPSESRFPNHLSDLIFG